MSSSIPSVSPYPPNMQARPPPRKDSPVVIIGAGVFGLSHALELKQRGFSNVTVLDRCPPPVCDGSSVDISRIIRVEYSDPFYTRMAKEALQGWLNDYKDHYHQSGFVILAASPGSEYIEKSKAANDSRLDEYDDANDVRSVYPDVQARLDGLKAYHNPGGGWADAAAAIKDLSVRCSLAGVAFVTGPRGTVLSLRQSGNRVIGVNVAEGDPISAQRVIVATGAWTNRLLPLSHAVSASGQPVGFIQLTPEEASSLTSGNKPQHRRLLLSAHTRYQHPQNRTPRLRLRDHIRQPKRNRHRLFAQTARR